MEKFDFQSSLESIEPNSHKYKESIQKDANEVNGKKVKKVISGSAKVKKKSEIRKITDIFISEDISNVKDYIIMDVLIPAIKKAVSDIVTNGIDMILYGESGRTKKSGNTSKISYRSFYDRENDRDYRSSRNGYSFDDITLDTRKEAEDVLSSMDEIISSYGIVSVSDFYELVGVKSNYTDNNYGWKDISSASVIRIRDGYMIKLPKAQPID